MALAGSKDVTLACVHMPAVLSYTTLYSSDEQL